MVFNQLHNPSMVSEEALSHSVVYFDFFSVQEGDVSDGGT